MIQHPPPSSRGYFRRQQLRNPTLTLKQRQRRFRKQQKRKLRRHGALLREFISPGAMYFSYKELVPIHLRNPVTRVQIRRHIDECNALYYFSAWGEREDYEDLVNGSSEVVLDTPRFVGTSRRTVASDVEGCIRLKNGHTVVTTALSHWFNHGFLRYAYRVIHEKNITRGAGEWSVMYPTELQEALPTINFHNSRMRKWYLVQLLRDDSGQINEARIYSANYAPILRLHIELLDSEEVPEACRAWWTHRTVPLPPYRRDLFEPVKELDEDGLPLIPGCPPMSHAEKEEMGKTAFRKMAAYVERLSRERELRL